MPPWQLLCAGIIKLKRYRIYRDFPLYFSKLFTMALFKSGNHALQEKSFEGTICEGLADHEVMTINGTLNRFGLLFLVMIGSTIWSWSNFYKGGDPMPFMLTGVFGGLVVALIM